MTTTVKIHVNGRYRATVVQTDADGNVRPPVTIEGAYDGSPNPTGYGYFYLAHPAKGTFEVTEEYLGDAPPKVAGGPA